jgi:hypothetical protein
VANNTTLNVNQLLLAVNKEAKSGVLYVGDATLQAQAADLLNYLDQAAASASYRLALRATGPPDCVARLWGPGVPCNRGRMDRGHSACESCSSTTPGIQPLQLALNLTAHAASGANAENRKSA